VRDLKSSPDPPEIAAFHGSTCHGEPPAHPERLVRFQPLDPANRPRPFKTYPGLEARPLPREIVRSSLPATDVLSGAHGAARELDDALLGTLLFLSAGVTRYTGPAREPIWFRAAMSAGNLHPVEVYVVRSGVHHYQPLGHAFIQLREPTELAGAGPGVALVLTGILFRTSWKYGERGWRHLWWDAGTMLANLLAVAVAHGLAARVLVGFDDDAVAALVGIDGVEEIPLAVVVLGEQDVPFPPAGALRAVTTRAAPVAPRVLRFPLADEAHAAGTLTENEVATWRLRAPEVAHVAPAEVESPSNVGAGEDRHIEDVILARGSTRSFRVEQAGPELLEWALPAAARAVPLDAAGAGASLIEHLVNVHDVSGTEPGGYRYTTGDGYQRLVHHDNPRAAGARLCLDQPLGGESAYTVFHAAALGPLLDALGARGYRAAQLEAGVVSGRLALNAFAIGAGATGLTFYDGLVSRYFGTAASPLLATAVGLPETGPAPSGTPGRPVELSGYGNVMARLTARLRHR